MAIKDIMTHGLVKIDHNETALEACNVMANKNISSVVVG